MKYLQKSTNERKKCIDVRFASTLWCWVWEIDGIKNFPVTHSECYTIDDTKSRSLLEEKWTTIIKDNTENGQTEV
jgi:hypothetical protein